MSNPDDVLQFVEGLDASDRVGWIGALDQACELAERRRRMFARKDRARAATAQSFVEQLKAVLFWLRTGDRPQTQHESVAPAIAHIARALGPRT